MYFFLSANFFTLYQITAVQLFTKSGKLLLGDVKGG